MNTSESSRARYGLTAIVLAGGRSSRFGADKASALLLGRPLLEWVVTAVSTVCARTVVVKAKGQRLPLIDSFEFVEAEDLEKDRGPLAAIVTGFERCDTASAFVVACDTPLLMPELVPFLFARLRDYDCVLPSAAGKPQPLCAIYRVEKCLDSFGRAVDEGRLGLIASLGERRSLSVSEDDLRAVDPELRSFLNANTPAALEEIAMRLAGQHP